LPERPSRPGRAALEGILLDNKFDLPSLEGVQEVVISKQVGDGTAPPSISTQTARIEPATRAPDWPIALHDTISALPAIIAIPFYERLSALVEFRFGDSTALRRHCHCELCMVMTCRF
jgi:hypothetical protein